MPKPLFVDYARMSAVIYYDQVSRCAGGFARTSFRKGSNGFQGGIFVRPNENGGLDYIVAYAGTQPGDDRGADVLTDAGFGGRVTSFVSGALSVMGGPFGAVLGGILGRGPAALESQLADAKRLLITAQTAAAGQAGSRLFLTGHSLGGGLAQIVAARTGVPAVGISAPAVTAVPGVTAEYARNRPGIVCLKILNDPINETERVGDRLGATWLLNSPRTGGAAHSIDQTVAELRPGGRFASIGAITPV